MICTLRLKLEMAPMFFLPKHIAKTCGCVMKGTQF